MQDKRGRSDFIGSCSRDGVKKGERHMKTGGGKDLFCRPENSPPSESGEIEPHDDEYGLEALSAVLFNGCFSEKPKVEKSFLKEEPKGIK